MPFLRSSLIPFSGLFLRSFGDEGQSTKPQKSHNSGLSSILKTKKRKKEAGARSKSILFMKNNNACFKTHWHLQKLRSTIKKGLPRAKRMGILTVRNPVRVYLGDSRLPEGKGVHQGPLQYACSQSQPVWCGRGKLSNAALGMPF